MKKLQKFLVVLLGVILILLAYISIFEKTKKPPRVNHYRMPSSKLQTLSKQYNNLRVLHSHFTGGEWNDDVDAFNSPKHKVMEELRNELGKPGTKMELLQEVMGEPDEITYDLDNPFQSPGFMPGPVVPGGGSADGKESNVLYLVYYWRGRHDFLWFKISDGEEAKVLESGWHNDLE